MLQASPQAPEAGAGAPLHCATLQKFAARISSALLDRVVRGFAEEADPSEPILGVDASGFKPSKASSYYTRSLKPRRVKRYVKCTLAVELKTQLVCGFKARRLARHDPGRLQDGPGEGLDEAQRRRRR